VRQFLLTLWNVYSFYVTYAIADGFDPGLHDIPAADRPVLDRWILSRLARTVGEARERLEAFDATGAGRRMAALVEDLSNWYVRRARRRFWDPGRGDAGAEKWAAYLTLEECLVTLAQLLAPLTPFLSEELWSNLAAGREGLADSVHLTDYPEPDAGRLDDPLEEAMRIAREVARLGRLVRNEARVKVRQPLRTAIVHVPGGRDLSKVIGIVADELNVREVELSESAQELGRWRAKPNFKVLGPRLGARVKDAARALAEDDGTLAAALAGGEAVQVAGVSLDPADVELVQETREGFGVASDGGVTVALDLAVDEELRLEGLARDLVRVVQDARKAAGLDVSDGIELGIEATGELAAALEAHGAYVAGETLARSVATGPISGAEGDPDLHEMDTSVDGIAVRISLARTRG
jgi:isoleucyl-tRNA synthetase